MNFLKKLTKSANEIRTQSLVIEDANGNAVAALGASPDGKGALVFADATGTPRIHIGIAETGEPAIVLLDQQGVERLTLQMLSVGAQEGPALFMRNAEKHPIITMGLTGDQPGLALGDINLDQLAELQATPKTK